MPIPARFSFSLGEAAPAPATTYRGTMLNPVTNPPAARMNARRVKADCTFFIKAPVLWVNSVRSRGPAVDSCHACAKDAGTDGRERRASANRRQWSMAIDNGLITHAAVCTGLSGLFHKYGYVRGQGFFGQTRREQRAYPQRSVRREQRSQAEKERPPGGLRRIWPGAALLGRSSIAGDTLSPSRLASGQIGRNERDRIYETDHLVGARRQSLSGDRDLPLRPAIGFAHLPGSCSSRKGRSNGPWRW